MSLNFRFLRVGVYALAVAFEGEQLDFLFLILLFLYIFTLYIIMSFAGVIR